MLTHSHCLPCDNWGVKGKIRVGLSILLTLGSGYVFADALNLTPGPLTFSTSVRIAPYPKVEKPVPAKEISTKHTPAPEEKVKELATQFASDQRVKGKLAFVVRDATTNKILYDKDGATPLTPASNTKVLTAVAALHTLGPHTTLPTRTMLSGSALYLVGGGDIFLGVDSKEAVRPVRERANINDLARQTAKSLKENGTTTITLKLDNTLFEGPPLNPKVATKNRNYMAPISAIAYRGGKAEHWGYEKDPAGVATNIFITALRNEGITVNPAPGEKTPANAKEIGRVESAPIQEIVDLVLTESDNSGAETLGHLIAVKTGNPPNFDGGAKATLQVLTKLGYPMVGVKLFDNSGLSEHNRITPNLLLAITSDVVTHKHPELESIGAGYAVSGVNGTLDLRIAGPEAGGRVRGKTGTLDEAVSLSGVVNTKSGHLIEFAIILDELKADDAQKLARNAEDDFLKKLATL